MMTIPPESLEALLGERDRLQSEIDSLEDRRAALVDEMSWRSGLIGEAAAHFEELLHECPTLTDVQRARLRGWLSKMEGRLGAPPLPGASS